MVDEEWTKDAMNDDSVAALMLLRLKQTRTRSPLPPPPAPTKPALHLDWTVRQRRSKSAPRHGDGKRKAEPARASPTTPLSWSGATSASGGALDGFEESSQPDKPTDGSRSKAAVKGGTTTHKRSRKKKSLAELRDEESLLLKERRYLKNELAALHLTLEKQRASNENLKRIKIDLLSQQTIKVTTAMASQEAIPDRKQEMEGVCAPTSTFPTGLACKSLATIPHKCQSKSSMIPEVRDRENSFVLPDLNLPLGEDSGAEILC